MPDNDALKDQLISYDSTLALEHAAMIKTIQLNIVEIYHHQHHEYQQYLFLVLGFRSISS